MPAAVIQVADAVVAELNAQAFSMPFAAARAYEPVFDLAEMKTLHVTVVPKGVEQSLASRGSTPCDVRVDVAVQKKLQAGDAAEIDPLMALVDEIAQHFRAKRLPQYHRAAWVRTENAPIYSPEHLADLRQFTSVVTFTFRIME